MEIAPVPHRATRSEWRRLALGLAVVAPIVLLVLVPAVLGLDRYVVTDRAMDGSLGRGSVVLAREVAPTDLHVGDVITFSPSGGGSDAKVTRRIVALHEGVATTQGDVPGSAPRVVVLDEQSYDRVWRGVPWLGYPFLLGGGWLLMVLAALAAFVLSMAAGRRTPHRVAVPGAVRVPVG